MKWKELLSLKVLQELGIDSVVNRYLIVALQQMSNSSQCLDRCKDVSQFALRILKSTLRCQINPPLTNCCIFS